MIEVAIPKHKTIAQFPDCKTCRDTGQIETPILSWRGYEYVGHGPCDCPTCRQWPYAAKVWAENNCPTIPAEVLESVAQGKGSKLMELRSCPAPECVNGPRFAAWLRGDREWLASHKDGTVKRPTEKRPYSPFGWENEPYHTPAGQEYVALWEEQKAATTQAAKRAVAEKIRAFRSGFGKPVRVLTTKADFHEPTSDEVLEKQRKVQTERARLEENERLRQEAALFRDAVI